MEYGIKLDYIDRKETLRYLRYRNDKVDLVLDDIINKNEAEILKVIDAKYIYKIFDIDIRDDYVEFFGSNLKLTGNAIRKHLKDCDKAVVMCATLSAAVDKIIRFKENSSMTEAVVIDALANTAIEQVCDKAEENIFTEYKGYVHTWRFGIGYGDLDISYQQKFLTTLDAQKRIGVCVTDNHILTPKKSVTCIIGLKEKKCNESEDLKILEKRNSSENLNTTEKFNDISTRDNHNCSECNFKDRCDFRRRGKK